MIFHTLSLNYGLHKMSDDNSEGFQDNIETPDTILDGVSRRNVLFALGTGVTALSGASQPVLSQTGSDDSDSTERLFEISYGGNSESIAPFSGEQSIKDVYDYGGYTSSLELQKEDTARLFLYDGPRGLSLGTIIDSTSSNDGGQTSYDIVGLPEDGTWAVKDDPGDIYGDTPSWSWSSGGNTDGGAYRGLDMESDNENLEFKITPALNEGRDDVDNDESGTVDGWEFVHGEFDSETGEFRDINVINMQSADGFEAVTINSDTSTAEASTDNNKQQSSNIPSLILPSRSTQGAFLTNKYIISISQTLVPGATPEPFTPSNVNRSPTYKPAAIYELDSEKLIRGSEFSLNVRFQNVTSSPTQNVTSSPTPLPPTPRVVIQNTDNDIVYDEIGREHSISPPIGEENSNTPPKFESRVPSYQMQIFAQFPSRVSSLLVDTPTEITNQYNCKILTTRSADGSVSSPPGGPRYDVEAIPLGASPTRAIFELQVRPKRDNGKVNAEGYKRVGGLRVHALGEGVEIARVTPIETGSLVNEASLALSSTSFGLSVAVSGSVLPALVTSVMTGVSVGLAIGAEGRENQGASLSAGDETANTAIITGDGLPDRLSDLQSGLTSSSDQYYSRESKFIVEVKSERPITELQTPYSTREAGRRPNYDEDDWANYIDFSYTAYLTESYGDNLIPEYGVVPAQEIAYPDPSVTDPNFGTRQLEREAKSQLRELAYRPQIKGDIGTKQDPFVEHEQ